MVQIRIDTKALMAMIRARAALSEIAYPNMTDEQVDQLLERILKDPVFDDMVRQCIRLDGEPIDDACEEGSSS